jgi:TPR repeat protein
MRLDDIELYRLLFWNNTLSPDELCLFGEKLAKEFPQLAYDTFMWLANVFEVTYSMVDNYQLAFQYYQKAAAARATEPEPYLKAANCYEPDLNIPPAAVLILFLKHGAERVRFPKLLFERLTELFEHQGNDEMSEYYRRKADGSPEPPQAQPPSQ